MGTTLQHALQVHDHAACSLISTVEAIPESRWSEPVAPGKWSAAQILEHLLATYEIILRELGGGSGMNIRTPRWQQLLLRLSVAPRILRGRGFPRGAPSPRELRPGEGIPRERGLALFQERAKQFETAAAAARPGQRITHAYFGKASLATGVLLCARHIEHHTLQIG